MKIAIVNTWAISDKSIGGTERFVVDLAESFARLGNEVDVFMFSGISHYCNGINYININLFNISGNVDEYVLQQNLGDFETDESYIELANRLEKIIPLDDYDVIQLNSFLFLECWKYKKRIFTIHTNPFEYELAFGSKSYKKVIEKIAKLKNTSETIFVAPSRYYAEEYTDRTGCNIVFIPHAIDNNRLKIDTSKNEIIKKYNLSEDKVKIIVPSRLEPLQKQPQVILEACKLLQENEKKLFEIIYTGLDEQYIRFVDDMKLKAEKYNIDIKIINVEHMAEIYKIADITILPSKSESFGYSALESMSTGIFTILNDIPTFNEIAQGNNFNYIYKNDIHELKTIIEKILKNKVYKKRIEPKQEWQEKYSIKKFAEKYICLFEKKERRELYNSDRIFLEKTIEKGEKIPEGMYYVTVVVWIQNDNGQFLIQKRSEKKDGKWATTGGHPIAGETSKEGIVSEIKEELGIDVDSEKIKLFKTVKTEDDFIDMYYMKENIIIDNLILQEEEVSEVKWNSINEIKEKINSKEFSESHIELFKECLKYLAKK